MSAMTRPKLTAEQYLAIERPAPTKSDFLDGEMLAMPGGTKTHSKIGVYIASGLLAQLDGGPFDVYSSDMRVRTVKNRHYTYPDVTVAPAEAEFEDGRLDILLNPVAIFEVLSPSTENYDRKEKFDLYFQVESFREYVLVSQDSVRVERMFRSGLGDWKLSVLTDIDDVLKLESVGAVLPLADIYRRVKFPPPKPPIAGTETAGLSDPQP